MDPPWLSHVEIGRQCSGLAGLPDSQSDSQTDESERTWAGRGGTRIDNGCSDVTRCLEQVEMP
jgi:hypothetical protein